MFNQNTETSLNLANLLANVIRIKSAYSSKAPCNSNACDFHLMNVQIIALYWFSAVVFLVANKLFPIGTCDSHTLGHLLHCYITIANITVHEILILHVVSILLLCKSILM